MKKYAILLFAAAAMIAAGCRQGQGFFPVKAIGDYAIEVIDDVPSGDVFAYSKSLQAKPESWPDICEGGCCAFKDLGNGDLIAGRNMDTKLSEYPVIVFRTSSGKYRTLNIAYYTGAGALTFEEFKQNGIPSSFREMMPFEGITDILNEKGLYIEADTRCDETDADGNAIIEYCTGTNPGKSRLFAGAVTRWVAENYAGVDEAVKALQDEVDIFNALPDGTHSRNLAFMIGDASGKYGLVELADNKVIFTPEQKYQASYYIAPELAEKSLYGRGYGRTELFDKCLAEIKSEDEMSAMLKLVNISNVDKGLLESNYRPSFDIRSELSRCFPLDENMKPDWKNGDPARCTTPWLTDDRNIETIMPLFKEYYLREFGDSTEVAEPRRMDPPACRNTAIHTVVNCNKATLRLRLFEDEEQVFYFSVIE